jgi:hypothetical protein
VCSSDLFKGRVDSITCGPKTVTFGGLLKDTTIPFTVVVTDNGEPGTLDFFSFQAPDYSVAGNLGTDKNGGGNIQVQSSNCDEIPNGLK